MEGIENTYFDLLKATRNALHKIPESGFKEFETSKYIQSVLKEWEITYEIVNGTGILVYFKGHIGDKTIAFRSDMDGLPVKEQSDNEVQSAHDGFMHACGHDGHMSMLLSFARFLKNNDHVLKDNILLIFQPAEEGPGGAELIVKAGILKRFNVSKIYGIHLNPLLSQGKIGLCSGPMMAMAGEFDIIIRSQSSHGAMPHEGIDSITIAAEIISGLQTLVSRNINPIKSAVLTIGKIEAGERRNIIAGRATLEGTMRAFEREVYYTMKNRMQEYLKGIGIAYGVIVDLDVRDMYPPVVNHAGLFDQFIHRMNNTLGNTVCEIIEPQMISEDFSYYQEAVPGLFYFVGTRNESKGYIHPLHHSEFNFDPIVLTLGLRTYIELLLDNACINELDMLK